MSHCRARVLALSLFTALQWLILPPAELCVMITGWCSSRCSSMLGGLRAHLPRWQYCTVSVPWLCRASAEVAEVGCGALFALCWVAEHRAPLGKARSLHEQLTHQHNELDGVACNRFIAGVQSLRWWGQAEAAEAIGDALRAHPAQGGVQRMG